MYANMIIVLVIIGKLVQKIDMMFIVGRDMIPCLLELLDIYFFAYEVAIAM
ncbi:hypothetical protein D3C85_1721540 [compost metagenome]